MNKEEFLQKLRKIRYATFDMDGTIIRPGLLIFDVVNKRFQEKNDTYKIGELKKIYESYSNVPFGESYRRFLNLLKGENREEFQALINSQLEAKTYHYARLAIKKLGEKYQIKSYLISLTTDFVADSVKTYFGFEEVYSVKCIVQRVGDKDVFTGEVTSYLDSARVMKSALLREFEQRLLGNQFLCAFDSEDDISIAQKASLRIGINQSKELKDRIKADIYLEGGDPWEEFYKML